MTDIHAEQRIDLLVDHDVDKIKKGHNIHIAPGMRKHKKVAIRLMLSWKRV